VGWHGLIVAGARYFSVQSTHTGSVSAWGSCLRGKGMGCEATRVKNEWSYASSPSPFMVCTETALHYPEN